MMKVKKCLGCGGIFEGRFSICQQCMELMNAVRLGAVSIPGRLKKNNLSVTRIILLSFAILLFGWYVFFLGVVSYSMWFFIFNNLTYNRLGLLLCLYLPLFIAITLGLFAGRLFGRKSVKLFLAQWLIGAWYDTLDRSARNLKYWLINSLLYFAWIALIVFLFVLVRIYLPESLIKNGPVYNTLFSLGLFMGMKIFFPALLIGYNLAFWVNTSWVKMIVK